MAAGLLSTAVARAATSLPLLPPAPTPCPPYTRRSPPCSFYGDGSLPLLLWGLACQGGEEHLNECHLTKSLFQDEHWGGWLGGWLGGWVGARVGQWVSVRHQANLSFVAAPALPNHRAAPSFLQTTWVCPASRCAHGWVAASRWTKKGHNE